MEGIIEVAYINVPETDLKPTAGPSSISNVISSNETPNIDQDEKVLTDNRNEGRNNQNEEKSCCGGFNIGVAVAIIASLGFMYPGFVYGYPAVSVPQMVNLTNEQTSWFASTGSVLAGVGCLLGGALSDTIGRKATLLLTPCPSIIGWMIIATSQNYPALLVGRALTSLSAGMVSAPARIYISEISEDKTRGQLLSISPVIMSFAICLVYILGQFLGWQTIAAIIEIFTIIASVAMTYPPESPAHLLAKGRRNDASIALKRLRGKEHNTDEELRIMSQTIESRQQQNPGFVMRMKSLTKTEVMKPLLLLSVYLMIYHFSGVYPVTNYIVSLFEELAPELNANKQASFIGVTRLVSSIVATQLIKTIGRKTLTFISSIGCGTTMIGLAVYAFVYTDCNGYMSWISIVLFHVHVATSTVGYVVVPLTMMAEVYPQEVRGTAAGLTVLVSHSLIFGAVKSFEPIKEAVTLGGIFCIYGTVSLLGTIFFAYKLPETKGLTFPQIQQLFASTRDNVQDFIE